MAFYTVVCSALLIIILGKSYCFDVTWKLMTNPVVANEDVMLSCYTNTALNDITEASWIKISTEMLDEIANKDFSTESVKYKVSLSSNQERIQYNLIIRDFEITDINFQYRCVLEFHEYTNYVVLNESNFIRLPTEDHIQQTFSVKNESIFMDIDMLCVFPKPTCHLVFEGIDYTRYLTVTSTHNSSMCYNTKIQYLIPNNNHPLCKSTTEIVCAVSSRQVRIKRGDVNVCTPGSTKQSSVIVPTIVVTATILFGILVLLVWMKCKGRLSCNKKHVSLYSSKEYLTTCDDYL